MSEGFFKTNFFVADATLFDFISVSYIGILTITYDIHYFAWGLCCGCIVKMTGSLLAEELSSCDCFWVKVSKGIVPFSDRGVTGLEPMSYTSVALPVSQGADSHPLPSTRVKAGRNNLNEEITPLLPTGIGERYSQTISNLGHTALVRLCELPL
jgi:hypothetical protein